ncbi:MAG: alpha-amylase family glycosyl hydrolase [Rikenellaceae bacterium]
MIHPDWSYSAVLYEMNVRQLTPEGTLRAATERLSFLRDLGIDVVWLMPIFPIGEQGRKGSLGSYYSIKDYCAVNEEFGSIEDFDAFLAEAHRLGMKVLLDWVANHTARDARWIREKPADWYERDENGVALIPWDWSDTAKLNYANHDVWVGQIEAMKFWVERGLDGFRCDMAMLVPIEFWQEVAAELHRVKPDVFMLAEAEELNLFDKAFDACYGWELHHLMCDVAKGVQRTDKLRDFIYNDRGYPRWSIPMMFTSNHDENSWQDSEYNRFGDALDAMSLFTFVVPKGLPLIYTGQEVGYDHSFEFFDRDSIPVDKYVEGKKTEFYRKLIEMKHNFTALKCGEMGGTWSTISNNAEDCLLIIVRETIEDRVVAIMNLSAYTIEASYNTGIFAGLYQNLFSGEETQLPTKVREFMSPWEYKVLTLKKM